MRAMRTTATLRLATRALPVLLVMAALFAACGGGQDPPATGVAPRAEERPVVVEASRPDVEDVTQVTSLAADLLPLRRAVLAAEVPGTVETLHVEVGDKVAAGKVVAEIDTRALEQAVAEAEALFRRAEARHQRAQALFEKRSVTKQALLDAVTDLDVAKARLASAHLDLEKSRIRAPWAGRVADKRVEVGDYATPGMPLVELVDAERLKVRAAAPASDVPFLEVGKPVKVTVDALPGETLEGKVVRLGAELDPGARTLDVEAEIPNHDGRLRPGMLARMELPLRNLRQAVLVPLEAVVDLGQRRVVYVVEGEKAHRREVSLGPVLGQRVVIAQGIGPDDRVITEGAKQVGEGQPVTLAQGS